MFVHQKNKISLLAVVAERTIIIHNSGTKRLPSTRVRYIEKEKIQHIPTFLAASEREFETEHKTINFQMDRYL